jgi:hypothetical protein
MFLLPPLRCKEQNALFLASDLHLIGAYMSVAITEVIFSGVNLRGQRGPSVNREDWLSFNQRNVAPS